MPQQGSAQGPPGAYPNPPVPYPGFPPPNPAYASVVGPPPDGMSYPHPHPHYRHGFPPPFGYGQYPTPSAPLHANVESLEGHCVFCEDQLFACQMVTFGECGHRCCCACFAEHMFQFRREPLVCPCGMRVQNISGTKNKETPSSRSKKKLEAAMTTFKMSWRDQEVYEKNDADEAAAAGAGTEDGQEKAKKPRRRHLTEQEKKEKEKREALESTTSRVPKIVRGWMLEDRAARVEGAVIVLYHQEKDKDKISARCIRLFNDGYISKASQDNLNKVMLLLGGANQKNLDEALETRYAEPLGEKSKKRKGPDEV